MSTSDTFSQVAIQTIGPLAGKSIWSEVSNWSDGAVSDDDNIYFNSSLVTSVDDVSHLNVDEIGASQIMVVGSSLNATSVATDGSSSLSADSLILGTPVSITVDGITGAGGSCSAVGPGARFVDNSATDLGNAYAAEEGGFLEISVDPNAASEFTYDGIATIAFDIPSSTVSSKIIGLRDGDQLELPGVYIEALALDSSGLTVTTSEGTYNFADAPLRRDDHWVCCGR